MVVFQGSPLPEGLAAALSAKADGGPPGGAGGLPGLPAADHAV